MSNEQRPTIDTDAAVEPAHPAPAQSPRPLGRDGLPEKRQPASDEERWEQVRDEPARPDAERP